MDIYKNQRQAKVRKTVPWADDIDRIFNGMEAADYNVRPLYKYVKAVEESIQATLDEEKKRGRDSTQHFLRLYLDQRNKKRK